MEKTKMKYGVFVQSENLDLDSVGLIDQTVYEFPDEEQAKAFVYDKFERLGLITDDILAEAENDPNNTTPDEIRNDVIDQVQESFTPLEYFHIYGMLDGAFAAQHHAPMFARGN